LFFNEKKMDPETQKDFMKEGARLPRRPLTLSPLAEAILEALSAEPLTANIILGGGVALKHYDDFRQTQDIDAWWKAVRDESILEQVKETLERVARANGYAFARRQFGATDSFEFLQEGKKAFSFQIALRDVPLDEPLPSAWPPILIETLRDNVGSKMNALVMRGAPRDFVDIYRVVEDGLIGEGGPWLLWKEKNPASDVNIAKGQVLSHLTRLESRRPLEKMTSESERQSAERLRRWFREGFLKKWKG
jgi:hypothetical protein